MSGSNTVGRSNVFDEICNLDLQIVLLLISSVRVNYCFAIDLSLASLYSLALVKVSLPSLDRCSRSS